MMNDELKGRLSRICGFMLAWMVILFTLAAAVYSISGSGDLLAREMLRFAPPETTGLPETEYPGVGRMTAAYLTGQGETFQYTFSDAEGRTWLCFRSYEADHMADCRDLIRLTGNLRWTTGAAVLIPAAGLLLRRRRAFAAGLLAGLCTAGVVITSVLLWAVADFDGLFVTFHRVAFSNDGWLLNPQTDLLIRLMPVNFFVSLGTRILIGVLMAGIALLGTGKMMRHAEIGRKNKKQILPDRECVQDGE